MNTKKIMAPTLSVRELTALDISYIVKYWTEADPENLSRMGADPCKLPSKDALQNALTTQIAQDYRDKYAYATIWLLDGEPIGHCNVNRIEFGESAYMHLHIWESDHRTKGMGEQFCRMSIPLFFKNLELQTLYCEPNAGNQGPNRTLKNLGFDFVKNWVTTPGDICFEQEVNLWKLEKSQN